MLRLASAALLCLTFALPGLAQEAAPDGGAPEPATTAAPDRSATGGAQTLEDILRRQRGEEVSNDFRRDPASGGAAPGTFAPQLSPLGGQSDAEIWRELRFNTADVTVATSSRGPAADVLVQDSGMRWLQFREGPLATYGGYLLLGTLALLAIFFLLRGRIRIAGGRSGIKLLRFSGIERFGHWLTAVSFVLLGLTGLVTLFGRMGLIPLLGKEGYATLALWSKFVHNNIAWAFMLGLVLIFVMWVLQNIPNRHDLVWLAKGGGMFSKNSHPPAKKFNAGQKIVFWSVIVLGASISASGLSLLFPFELPMFAKTFGLLNDTGLPQAVGYGALPETLAPHQEMQLSQLWHSIVAFLFMAIILAHIYLGTLGMEGAFDAMGSGEVDLQWAKEHHNLWVEELEERGETRAPTAPAE